jgi:hypothetical protein
MNFDPASFVNLETTEALVRRPPIAEGDYLATIGEVKSVAWSSDKGSGVRLVVPLTIQVPPEQQDKLGQSEIKLTDSVMLDLTEGGTLDMGVGKNNALRRYREATDLNKPGEAFSPARLMGRLIRAKVKHELYQGDVQERVAGVAKA